MCNAGEGVCVQASTLGSLEALLEFLKSPAVKIPVSGINIGPVHKKDIMRASVMLEKGRQKFACLLAFDVPVTKEAREMAESLGVKVFTADIIYHLFDQFTAYLKTVCKSLLYQDKCSSYVTSPCLPPLPLPPSPLSLAYSQGYAIMPCGTGYAVVLTQSLQQLLLAAWSATAHVCGKDNAANHPEKISAGML